MNRIVSNSLPVFVMLLAFAFAENRAIGQAPPTVVPRPTNHRPTNQSQTNQRQTNQPTPVSNRDDDLRSEPEVRIREVLQGNPPAPTGDGVLEDVLGVIQRQGSVLDGSTLNQPPMESNAISRISEPGTDPDTRTFADQRALVAEQLLRAARMLQRISKDNASAKLVASMRRQAAGLLIVGENPTP